MDINIKLTNEYAKIPTRGSAQAAGYDLYSGLNSEVSIRAHETVKIDTGIAIEIPNGYFGAIYARSGLATSRGLRPSNCVGVIDSDYRGNIIVALHNDTDEIQIVGINERIAQLVIQPYLPVSFNIVTEDLNETNRGSSGFGDSGRF